MVWWGDGEEVGELVVRVRDEEVIERKILTSTVAGLGLRSLKPRRRRCSVLLLKCLLQHCFSILLFLPLSVRRQLLMLF